MRRAADTSAAFVGALIAIPALLCGCLGPGPGVLYEPRRGPVVEPEPVVYRSRSASVPGSWRRTAPAHKWRYIVIHHSATQVGGAERFDREHRARIDHTYGLGYHFVVGNGSDTLDGQVETGARWKRQMRGAHCGNDFYNAHGVGICLVGNFQQRAPSRKQMAATEKLVRYLQLRYDIPANAVIGHRHIKNTLCPGKYFPYRSLLADLTGGDRMAGSPVQLGK